jgi:hypothetical protein
MLWRLRNRLLKRGNKNHVSQLPADTLLGRLLALPQCHLKGLLVAPPLPLGRRPMELSPRGALLPHQLLVMVLLPP